MPKIAEAFLRLFPTCWLQEALGSRPGVTARFVMPGEVLDLSVKGICWVTINED